MNSFPLFHVAPLLIVTRPTKVFVPLVPKLMMPLAPPPTVVVPLTANVLKASKMAPFPIVNELVIVNAAFTVITEPFPPVRELQVRVPSTVKVKPFPTTISSVGAGIIPPGQGASGIVELQFPLPVVTMVAARSDPEVRNNRKSKTRGW